MNLIKPQKLNKDDKIATISPCGGAAGENDIIWKYKIGQQRLEEMGLEVVAAPNSMKGEEYLQKNPEARAEDILWTFDKKDIKAIIANIGGNDSKKVLPYLKAEIIKNNPKIFIGYSDVMNFHLFCYKAGLSTFYGHNLLPVLAETPNLHPYSKQCFERVLFDSSPIGEIKPAETFSCDESNYTDRSYAKTYHNETGYLLIQGGGKVQGRLFGGHTGIRDFAELVADDFADKILFIEDISEFFTPKYLADFVDWLGNIGALQKLKGLLIGRLCEYKPFDEHKSALLEIVNDKYGLINLPIMANMNFGHTSPTCVLPYGAMAEIDCEKASFSILESGVVQMNIKIRPTQQSEISNSIARIAPCGLVCKLCHLADSCEGCRSENNCCGMRKSAEGCYQYNCCAEKGIHYGHGKDYDNLGSIDAILERIGVQSMEIKIAGLQDVETIAKYDKWICTETIEKKVLDQQIYVVYDNNNFVGWMRYNLFWDNTPFMSMLHLLLEYRGKGMGKQLVMFWEEQMKAMGHKVLLTSTAQTETSQHFYVKLGYKAIGSFTLASEPLEIIFSKEL